MTRQPEEPVASEAAGYSMGDVISLAKKRMDKAIAEGKVPLYNGPDLPPVPQPDQELVERLARIRQSLERINQMVKEIKEKHRGSKL